MDAKIELNENNEILAATAFVCRDVYRDYLDYGFKSKNAYLMVRCAFMKIYGFPAPSLRQIQRIARKLALHGHVLDLQTAARPKSNSPDIVQMIK